MTSEVESTTPEVVGEKTGDEGMTLVERIRKHYDLCSSYYYNLWGEHIHHGLYLPTDPPSKTKESAQLSLIHLLLSHARLPISLSSPPIPALHILDVGCGVGGTTRYLARELGAQVTGVTLSGEQVKMGYQLSKIQALSGTTTPQVEGREERVPQGALGGSVDFIQLDAAEIAPFFTSRSQQFDIIWISEALSHLPNKPLFFSSAASLLVPGGKLVIADWFMAEHVVVGGEEWRDVVRPIEVGMLLPPLGTMGGYEEMAREAGLKGLEGKGRNGWEDVSKEVARTWDISLTLIASPSLWAFALTQGSDAIAFLKAFQAMRRGYREGGFVYGVRAYEKK